MTDQVLVDTTQPRLLFVDSAGNVHDIDTDDWSVNKLKSARDLAILGALVDLVAARYGSPVSL